MKTNRTTAMAAVMLFSLALVSCRRDVELKSHSWSFANGVCTVEFTLKNHNREAVWQRVQIVAHRPEAIGKGAMTNTILGEMTFPVQLQPGEEKRFVKTMNVFPNLKPRAVTVSHSGGE